MADYSPTTWVENVTKVGPTRMNALEQGVADASKHNATGANYDARPPADAAHKNWIWRNQETGVAYYCDGTKWVPMAGGKSQVISAQARTFGANALTGHSLDGSTTALTARGIQFTAATNGEVGIVRAKLSRDAALTRGHATAYLYADSVASPGQVGNMIASSKAVDLMTVTGIGGSYVQVIFRMGAGAALVAGQKYWILIRVDSLVGGAMQIQDESSAGLGVSGSPDSFTWSYDTVSVGIAVHVVSGQVRVVTDNGDQVGDTMRVEDPLGRALGWIDGAGVPGGSLGGWTETDLINAVNYTIAWPNGASAIEIEMIGRMAGTPTSFIMVRPSGNGTVITGRVIRKFYFNNTVDGTGEGVANDAASRDQGLCLAIFETNPTDTYAHGVFDMLRGIGKSQTTDKARDGTANAVIGHDFSSMLSAVGIPTSVVVAFNIPNSSNFTGKLRWQFR